MDGISRITEGDPVRLGDVVVAHVSLSPGLRDLLAKPVRLVGQEVDAVLGPAALDRVMGQFVIGADQPQPERPAITVRQFRRPCALEIRVETAPESTVPLHELGRALIRVQVERPERIPVLGGRAQMP